MATYRSWTLPDIKTHPHSLPVAAQLHSATNEIVKFLPNTPLAIAGDLPLSRKFNNLIIWLTRNNIKLNKCCHQLPSRGWGRISLGFRSFHAHVLWATVSFHLLTVDISICHCSNTTTIPLPNSCFLLRGQAATESGKHETSCDYFTFDWRSFHCHSHFAS